MSCGAVPGNRNDHEDREVMTLSELDILIALGEGLTIEFKESVSHLGREICGMANVQGGYVLIGIND